MKLQRDMEFNGKHFNPNSMMHNLLHRGVYFRNLFFKDNAHVKFQVVYFSDLEIA